ncbi:MAG: hypothetical protein M3Q84_00110 [Actinomycetota bacterium]|nr:hypothetical protein [Actinomycetota bacterium]
MAARYGDRFRQLPPTSTHDVLDLGEMVPRGPEPLDDHDPDETGPAPERRVGWAIRLALAAALVVGAAGGAYGWERWRVHESDLVARSAVELVASAVTLDYAADDQIALALRYRNVGEYTIVVRDVGFDTERLVAISDPELLQIAPGGSATHVVKAQAQCPEGGDGLIDQPRLVLDALTVDGTTTDEVIDIGLNAEVMQWLTYACQAQAYEPTFAQSYAEVTTVTPSEDGTAVRAVVEFGVEEDDELQIEAVQALTGAFSVVYTVGDMSSSTSFHAPPITVVFRVADCALAQQAADDDMSPSVAGSINGGASGRLIIFPSATLAAELVRLTERSCPA